MKPNGEHRATYLSRNEAKVRKPKDQYTFKCKECGFYHRARKNRKPSS